MRARDCIVSYLKQDVDMTHQLAPSAFPTAMGQGASPPSWSLTHAHLSHPWGSNEVSLNPPYRLAVEMGLLKCQGKTPEATMASALYTDVKRKLQKSLFTRCGAKDAR